MVEDTEIDMLMIIYNIRLPLKYVPRSKSLILNGVSLCFVSDMASQVITQKYRIAEIQTQDLPKPIFERLKLSLALIVYLFQMIWPESEIDSGHNFNYRYLTVVFFPPCTSISR